MTPHRWLVELDVSERAHGAVRFAKWYREQAEAGDPHMVGLNVSKPRALSFALPVPGPGSAAQQRGDELRAMVNGLGAEGVFSSIEVVEAPTPDQALTDRAERDGAGIVIAREGAAEGWSLVALGSTVRRLLRRSNAPVAIVPPDLDVSLLERDGPVVVAVAADETAITAVQYARRIASQLHRTLVGVHAVHIPATVGAPGLAAAYAHPSPDRELSIAADATAAKRARVVDWVRDHDLDPLPLDFAEGPAPVVVDRIAEAHRACLIVCGSRRLSLAERAIQTSVGTDLAAHSRLPVLVVPPDRDPALER